MSTGRKKAQATKSKTDNERARRPPQRDIGNRNHRNTLFEARVVIGDFKHEHNHRHRHSALGYQTPAEYAAACTHTHTPVACEIN